jgi:hypothetical protein
MLFMTSGCNCPQNCPGGKFHTAIVLIFKRILERETSLELATSTLARLRSTN